MTEAVKRDQIKADLEAEGSPYWRLKTLMDAWCALWFWPLDKASLLDGSDPIYQRSATVTHVSERIVVEETVADDVYEKTPLPFDAGVADQLALPLNAPTKKRATTKKVSVIEQLDQRIPLADLDNWLDFAEAVVGRSDIPPGSLVDTFTSLASLKDYEEQLPQWTGMDPEYRLPGRFPWLPTVTDIADDQGFFHWEIEFAQAFANGGFDLQVGNPPWVRLDWDEGTVLAEREPWFVLTAKPDANSWRMKKSATLATGDTASDVLQELARNSGTVQFSGSIVNYPLLAGTRLDLYRAFMCQVWSHIGPDGSAGLMHPDTHFNGTRETNLRASAYQHLRVHAGFVNEGYWAFRDLGNTIEFGLHIYGKPAHIDFVHLSRLLGAQTLADSLTHDGSGPIPGLKHLKTWDLRPHLSRVISVNASVLADWNRITGTASVEPRHAALLHPVTSKKTGQLVR